MKKNIFLMVGALLVAVPAVQAAAAAPAPAATPAAPKKPTAEEKIAMSKRGFFGNVGRWLYGHGGEQAEHAAYGRFLGKRDAVPASEGKKAIQERKAATDSVWGGWQDVERYDDGTGDGNDGSHSLKTLMKEREEADALAYRSGVKVKREAKDANAPDAGDKFTLVRGDTKVDGTGEYASLKEAFAARKDLVDPNKATYTLDDDGKTLKRGDKVLAKVGDRMAGQPWFGHAKGILPVAASYAGRGAVAGLSLESMIRRNGLNNRAMAALLRAIGKPKLADLLLSDSKLALLVRILLNTGIWAGSDYLLARAVDDYSLLGAPYNVYKHFRPERKSPQQSAVRALERAYRAKKKVNPNWGKANSAAPAA